MFCLLEIIPSGFESPLTSVWWTRNDELYMDTCESLLRYIFISFLRMMCENSNIVEINSIKNQFPYTRLIKHNFILCLHTRTPSNAHILSTYLVSYLT